MNISGELRYFVEDGFAKLTFSESATSMSIDTVFVPSAQRGRGIGAALIQRVLLIADASEREVHVSARPMGASGEIALERLVAYYRRFGFEQYERGSTVVFMRRAPRRPESLRLGAPTLDGG